MENRGVVRYVDVLDGQGGDLRDEDAPKGVGDAGVNTDEGEGGIELLIFVKLYGEVVAELIDVPGVVFAEVVARELGGRDIRDRLVVDADCLRRELVAGVKENCLEIVSYPTPVDLILARYYGSHVDCMVVSQT